MLGRVILEGRGRRTTALAKAASSEQAMIEDLMVDVERGLREKLGSVDERVG